MAEFLAYLKSSWIIKKPNWHEHYELSVPTSTNGLESTNGKIKSVFTENHLLKMTSYVENCFKLIKN